MIYDKKILISKEARAEAISREASKLIAKLIGR